jgi:hypothetical protein
MMAASCAVAVTRTMDNPSPCPSLYVARRRSSRWKGWERRSTSAGGMSGPVLVTDRMAWAFLIVVLTSTGRRQR